MALRLLEAYLPTDLADVAKGALAEASAQEIWSEERGPIGSVVTAVIGAGRTGSAIDLLYARLSNVGGFRILVMPLEAVVPRPPAERNSRENVGPRDRRVV